MEYRDKATGDIYVKLADATNWTLGRHGEPVVVFCRPAPNSDAVLVCDAGEFAERFEPAA